MTETQPKSQTALDLWNEHVQALTDPTHSETAINTIYERLMRLHGSFVKNEMPKQAGQVEEAYNLALAIYQDLQQRQIVIAGGVEAIKQAETQRLEAITELKMLLQSIEKGDEEHPKLSDYASAIREDERQDTLNDPWMLQDVYESAAEQADEALYDMIMNAWDTPYEAGDAVIGLLIGNIDPTLEQKELIERLFETVSRKRPDTLASVARDLGGHSADDEASHDSHD